MGEVIDFEVAKFRRWAKKNYGDEYQVIEKIDGHYMGNDIKILIGHFKGCVCDYCEKEKEEDCS